MSVKECRQFPDFQRFGENLQGTLSNSFIASHPQFVEFAICGILFRHGIEDPGLIEAISGKSIDDTVLGIVEILFEPEASVHYFAALDRFDTQGISDEQTSFPVSATERKPQ